MNRADATGLARIAAAARPQQRWDDATPDVWTIALDDIRIEDAREALTGLIKAAAFIDVPALRQEVKRIRTERIRRHESRMPVFPGDPDDARAELAWRREMERRIGDGEVFESPDALVARAMPRLDGVWKRPPVRDVTQSPAPPRPTLREPESVFRDELQRGAKS